MSLTYPAILAAITAPINPRGITSKTENGIDQLSYNAAKHKKINMIDAKYEV